MKARKDQKGMSLLEVLLGIALFAIMASTIGTMTMGGFAGLARSEKYIEAANLAQEGSEAVKFIKNVAWNDLIYNQSAVYELGPKWILGGEGTTEVIDDYIRRIDFYDVCRDAGGDIADCPALYTDPHTKKAQVEIEWDLTEAATTSIELINYITNWESSAWSQTDWSGGDAQSIWSDNTRFDSDDTNIYYDDIGEIKLYNATEGGGWFPSGGKEYTDTTDTDFDAGAFNDTQRVRTGASASINLAEQFAWIEHADSQASTTENINDIDIINAANAWAAANNGEILNYNGTNWSKHSDMGVNNLNAIEMLSASQGWAVGDLGDFYEYDGNTWSNPLSIPEITQTTFTEFNAGSFTNTVATTSAGNGEVVLAQTTAWSEHANSGSATTQNLRSISVVAPDDIWAVGDSGKILHYDGASWTEDQDMGSQTVRDIDMISSTDGWAVGNSSKIWRYNGASWSQFVDLGGPTIQAIDMISPTEGWAAGNSGRISYYNGSAWSQFIDAGGQTFYDIEMLSASDGWIAGNSGRIWRYNGSSWSQFVDTGGMAWYNIDMIDSDDGWISGSSGKIWRYNGSSWSEVIDTGGEVWYGLDMLNASQGYAASDDGNIREWNGAAWNLMTSPTTSILRSIIAIDENQIWAVGNSGTIIEYGAQYFPSGTFSSSVLDSGASGTNWGTASWTENLPAGSDLTIAARSGDTATPDGSWSAWSAELTTETGSAITSPNARYLQYRATLTRGTNPNETPELSQISITYNEPTNADLKDLSIVAANDIWMAGSGGFIANYNGTSLVEVSSPIIDDLNSIDMLSASEGWAVGNSGKILYYNGSSWSEFTDTGAMNWQKIQMISATEGWVAGTNGLIYNYNGATWSEFQDTGGMTWHDLDFASASNGWAAGSAGNTFFYDGADWTDVNNTVGQDIFAVDLLDAQTGWAAGAGGVILTLDQIYFGTGTFLSQIFDGEEVDPGWDVVFWQEVLPAGSDLTISTRTGANPTPDAGWTSWGAEMTDEVSSSIPAEQNDRYLQYRATLTRATDPNETPELDYITITYAGAVSFLLNDIAVLNENEAWAVGNTGKIAYWDGVSWVEFTDVGGTNLLGVDVLSATNAWAVGQGGEVYNYNGTSWSLDQDTGGHTWYAIDMVSANDGWMSGNSGKIWHYDGASWSEFDDMGNRNIMDIFMTSAAQGWAVGNSGKIYSYDGVSWSEFQDTGGMRWEGIYMLTANDGWVVGSGGNIYQWNGSSWNSVSTPTSEDLNDVYAFASNDAIAVGDNGTIIRWDGIQWLTVDNPNTDDLHAIGMYSNLGGWAVGFKGVVTLFREEVILVPPSGWLISSAFDMGDESPVEIIEWDQEIPAECDPISACAIQFQVRTAPDNGGIPGTWSNWYGASGTGTYFTQNTGELIPNDLNWNQWMQYRVEMASDEVVTPILYEVRIDYK